MHGLMQWRWHLDEVFVRINGKTYYLCLAVDHEGEVLEEGDEMLRSSASMLQFTTTSINNVTSTAARILKSIAPSRSPSGVNLLPDAGRAAPEFTVPFIHFCDIK